MASFRFTVNGQEQVFPDKKVAVVTASKIAYKDNKIIEVFEEKNGGWEVCATLYPSGEVRYPVDINKFADSLPIRRKRLTP